MTDTASPAGIETPMPTGHYANPDLLPVPLAQRRWTTYNFAALWVGMAHNIASWTLASGLVALGKPGQSFRVNLTANVVLFPLLVGLLSWLGLAGAGIHAMVQGVFVMGAMTLLFMRQIARHRRIVPVP